ncbi:hypothetical protein BD410DRAFT_751480 [Rickenella mellea]|uniref:F-box domain-containing protein n=1 Tax=Rickenella mellea TaxID=50990 RepID=A0A4Y7PZU8_9AGAM|nr:hypothetical protein BD410DRAFT_751480 [Rickenella mellea]
MDADIAQVEMTRLRPERAAVLDDVQRYEALLSSVRRLMNIPELIGEIFIHCIPDPTDIFAAGKFGHLPRPFTYSYVYAGRHDAPLALSHVCRTWRRISLTAPRLWATFAVNARHYRSIAAMNLWLSRSRSYPLSFCIQFELHESSILNATDILALARHQNRWKNVSVKGTDMLEHFLSSVTDTYPVLERLHLSEDNRYIDTYVSAPNLTQLELTGCFLMSDKLHLPNLREITIHDMWLYDCLSMCRQHQALQRAAFHISSPGTMAPDADIVELPALKDLHLSTPHAAAPTDASDLLMNIRAPSLKKLHIHSEIRLSMSIRDAVLPFLQRSSALVTSLHVDGRYSNMDSLVEFISHIPHLQQLSLASSHLNSDDLLAHLQTPIITNTSTVLCAPELAVIGPLSPNPTLDSLVDFIISRRINGHSALRDVVVPDPHLAFELRSHPGVSECIKNGLQVLCKITSDD